MIARILKDEIEAYAARMRHHPLLELARRGGVSPDAAANYLANVRFLLGNSPRQIQLARRNAEARGARALAEHLGRKLLEEVGHDHWAEADLERLHALFGSDTRTAPARALLELIAYVDAAIQDEPARYLAYALLMEYFTVLIGPEWVAVLEEHCGVPKTAMTVVTRHVAADAEHVQEGFDAVDELVGDPALSALLHETVLRAAEHLTRLCDEIHEAALRPAPRYRSAS